MDKVTEIEFEIEKIFKWLESFWEEEVPEALNHNGWSEDEVLIWGEEARGVPFVQYNELLKDLQGELKIKYQDRLDKLDNLIEKYKPALLEFLNS